MAADDLEAVGKRQQQRHQIFPVPLHRLAFHAAFGGQGGDGELSGRGELLQLVPRILEGWICGLIFQLVKKFSKNGAFIVASLSCPLLNTLFFMSSLVLFFYNTEYIQGLVTKLGATNPLIFVILFVGVQGAIEAVACTILGSAVSRALAAAFRQ